MSELKSMSFDVSRLSLALFDFVLEEGVAIMMLFRVFATFCHYSSRHLQWVGCKSIRSAQPYSTITAEYHREHTAPSSRPL